MTTAETPNALREATSKFEDLLNETQNLQAAAVNAQFAANNDQIGTLTARIGELTAERDAALQTITELRARLDEVVRDAQGVEQQS